MLGFSFYFRYINNNLCFHCYMQTNNHLLSQTNILLADKIFFPLAKKIIFLHILFID